MQFHEKSLGIRILSLCVIAAAAGAGGAFGADQVTSTQDPAERLLQELHPDFREYVDAVRPIVVENAATVMSVYMAMVRPGANNPTAPASAPFAGAGARNDIVYDPGILSGDRSAGWTLLLLDHEYFHARHLAGATSLPLPGRTGAEIEHHFYEAAAWGYTVGQARAGRYPGLRPDEFREALDRYGDHYRALRSLTGDTAQWPALATPLLEPAALVTRNGSSPPGARVHPSGSGR